MCRHKALMDESQYRDLKMCIIINDGVRDGESKSLLLRLRNLHETTADFLNTKIRV